MPGRDSNISLSSLLTPSATPVSVDRKVLYSPIQVSINQMDVDTVREPSPTAEPKIGALLRASGTTKPRTKAEQLDDCTIILPFSPGHVC